MFTCLEHCYFNALQNMFANKILKNKYFSLKSNNRYISVLFYSLQTIMNNDFFLIMHKYKLKNQIQTCMPFKIYNIHSFKIFYLSQFI